MKLNRHNEKPPPKFFGKSDYHLGIELEVECGTAENRTHGLGLLNNPSYCYAKTDGSLQNEGWELVTHPISKDMWMCKNNKRTAAKSFFNYVENLRKIGYTSHSNTRCGLHIHVSLCAFGVPCIGNISNKKRRKSHLYWFMRLVNSDLYKRISQRDDVTLERWTKLVGVRASSFHLVGTHDRYVTTNVTERTIEIRIFRGNMREDRIRKCIESVVAGVAFSKKLRVSDYIEFQKSPIKLTDDFLKYVEENADTYTNLYKYLVEIGQIGNKTSETVEPEKKKEKPRDNTASDLVASGGESPAVSVVRDGGNR